MKLTVLGKQATMEQLGSYASKGLEQYSSDLQNLHRVCLQVWNVYLDRYLLRQVPVLFYVQRERDETNSAEDKALSSRRRLVLRQWVEMGRVIVHGVHRV